MSTDLARELDHRYRTRFANDEGAKTLHPQEVTESAVDGAREDVLAGRFTKQFLKRADAEKQAQYIASTHGLKATVVPKDGQFEVKVSGDAEPLAMPPAKDAGYVAARIGQYQIIEGTGPDGGFWFAKGGGENKRFRSRRDAEEHAKISIGE